MCAVCLDDLEGELTTTKCCMGQFHTACLDEWLERNQTCPKCTADPSVGSGPQRRRLNGEPQACPQVDAIMREGAMLIMKDQSFAERVVARARSHRIGQKNEQEMRSWLLERQKLPSTVNSMADLHRLAALWVMAETHGT